MTNPFLGVMTDAVGIQENLLDSVSAKFTQAATLPSCFQTSTFASASVMTAALALYEYCCAQQCTTECALNSGTDPYQDNDSSAHSIVVNERLASLWFDKSVRTIGWQAASVWDSIAGNYRCKDAWIRLHTNAAHHKAAALSVLRCEDNKTAVAAAAENWLADELEVAVVVAGGCAARMRSMQEWNSHAQGASVRAEPLVHWRCAPAVADVKRDKESEGGASVGERKKATVNKPTQALSQPLTGIKVLDLTRVLAGPVCTRFLAAYGANVLRIDPEHWNETAAEQEMTVGKRCAHLDLKTDAGKAQFLSLVSDADLLVHGYRADALAALGLAPSDLRKLNPTLITVCLNAYGWTGPWVNRRGFDSLVQMSCGIAAQGMSIRGTQAPVPLPVQALDHATGYLMAASALHALAQRQQTGKISDARLSLARTAVALMDGRSDCEETVFEAANANDFQAAIEHTSWGDINRLVFPIDNGLMAKWLTPATKLRTAEASWV